MKHRTASTLYFSSHATSKTHISVRTGAGFLVFGVFLGCLQNTGENVGSSASSQRCYWQFGNRLLCSIADCVTCWCTCWHPACRANLLDSLPQSRPWNMWWGTNRGLHLPLLLSNARNISVFLHVLIAVLPKGSCKSSYCSLQRQFWTVTTRTLKLCRSGEGEFMLLLCFIHLPCK